MIVLVIGGTRSGKSEVAERLAARFGDAVTYVATGFADEGDVEMAARIDRHRARRPATWTTIDRPADLVATLTGASGTVLLDSLGTSVATADGFVVDDEALCAALRERDGDTVVVTEEVGLSVHPTTATGRRFADALGALNRAVAAVADDAWFVVAGRVLRLSDVADVADVAELDR
jgi:adenosyl cobinamide kinase/adenosyl cobinamide phosphate guanylyltransferase